MLFVLCVTVGVSSSADISLSLRIKEFPILARQVQTKSYHSVVKTKLLHRNFAGKMKEMVVVGTSL